MNSDNNLIRKIFSIGIAYLVALAGIELYVYKIEGNPVYSGKITSNIIPYADVYSGKITSICCISSCVLPVGMYYYEHSGSKEQIKVIRQ